MKIYLVYWVTYNPNVLITIIYILLHLNINYNYENKNKVKEEVEWTIWELLNRKKHIINKKYPEVYEEFEPDESLIPYLKHYVNDTIKDFINYFYIKGKLQDAIKSDNEIMIDCDEYYIVPDRKKEILKELWLV